jgi:hypothetical protein
VLHRHPFGGFIVTFAADSEGLCPRGAEQGIAAYHEKYLRLVKRNLTVSECGRMV